MGCEMNCASASGRLPDEAETLLDMARLRVLGAALGLQHVLVRGDEARLTFRAGTQPAARRAHLRARRRAARRRSAPDRAALAPAPAARRRTDRARTGAGAAPGAGGREVGRFRERSHDRDAMDTMRRTVLPALLVGTVAIAGCGNFRDLFSAHADMAAEAAGPAAQRRAARRRSSRPRQGASVSTGRRPTTSPTSGSTTRCSRRRSPSKTADGFGQRRRGDVAGASPSSRAPTGTTA